MKKLLLIIGGIFNTLFGVFHIWMARGTHLSDSFSPGARALVQAYNVFGIIVVFYFAYISFFQQRDLLSTKLGKTTLALVALVYLSRGIEEFIFFKFSYFIFIPCVLVGGIYTVLLFLPGFKSSNKNK
jgi:asparagine N-glycosylation enzyme membrane subunit Stt3